MNIARYDFACAEVNGAVYAVGGYGSGGDSLSSAEVYDPDRNEWRLIESLKKPRYGCFACSFEDKLYVMGGRSSFTIGSSRSVDVYDPSYHSWCEIKNGCVMVTAHAVLGKRLFCMEWRNQRKLSIFDPADGSWRKVSVPLTGSSKIGFRFGILDGKLLLFSLEEEPGYQTLMYDPDAPMGAEWRISTVKPSGQCLCTVTIKAWMCRIEFESHLVLGEGKVLSLSLSLSFYFWQTHEAMFIYVCFSLSFIFICMCFHQRFMNYIMKCLYELSMLNYLWERSRPTMKSTRVLKDFYAICPFVHAQFVRGLNHIINMLGKLHFGPQTLTKFNLLQFLFKLSELLCSSPNNLI